MARWEFEDPILAIDAQLRALTDTRAACQAQLGDAEQRAVAAAHKGDDAAEATARTAIVDNRSAVRDYSAEIDELQTERRVLLPTRVIA